MKKPFSIPTDFGILVAIFLGAVFVVVLWAFLGYMIWYITDHKPKEDIRNRLENSSAQLMLVNDAYYFPPANNKHLSPLLQYSPDVIQQKCANKDYSNTVLVYADGTGLSFKNNTEVYVHEFGAEHLIYKNWFLPAELFERKFSSFCATHFPQQ